MAEARGETIEADLLILGGGMIGLTLAKAVAGVGIRTVLLDRGDLSRQAEPVFDGRVSAIASASRRILEGIGVWSALAPEAQPILEIRVADGEAPFFLHYDHRDLGETPLGFIVENRVIRRALTQAVTQAEGIRLFAPAKLASLERYQRWRRFDALVLVAVTDGLNRLFSNDIPPVRLVRDLGLAAVNRTPPLKRFFMRHAMGTLGDLPRLAAGEPL